MKTEDTSPPYGVRVSPRPLRRSEGARLTRLHLRGAGLQGLRYRAAWPHMFLCTHLMASKTYTDGSSFVTIIPPQSRRRLRMLACAVGCILGGTLVMLRVSVFNIVIGALAVLAVIFLSALAFALAAGEIQRSSSTGNRLIRKHRSELPRNRWLVTSLMKSPEAPNGSGVNFAREAILQHVPPGARVIATARTPRHARIYERLGLRPIAYSLLLIGQIPEKTPAQTRTV